MNLSVAGNMGTRLLLAQELASKNFITDKTGVKTVEIVGASFVVDEPMLFGTPNEDYIQRELAWYNGQSLNVYDIPGKVPEIWLKVCDENGFINSNYGHILYSEENGNQYDNVVVELNRNPFSRRAVAIYNRPSMWKDYNLNGRSDFVCTNAVQYLIRGNQLHCVVQMRSNDAVFGFNNDRAWHQHVLEEMANIFGIPPGTITWQAGSLHVYERHFYLLHHWAVSGEPSISKGAYKDRYPKSEWA